MYNLNVEYLNIEECDRIDTSTTDFEYEIWYESSFLLENLRFKLEDPLVDWNSECKAELRYSYDFVVEEFELIIDRQIHFIFIEYDKAKPINLVDVEDYFDIDLSASPLVKVVGMWDDPQYISHFTFTDLEVVSKEGVETIGYEVTFEENEFRIEMVSISYADMEEKAKEEINADFVG